MKTHLAKNSVIALASALSLALMPGCASNKSCCGSGNDTSCPAPAVTKAPFGTVDGKPVELYTLRNKSGSIAKIMTYGGIVQSLKVPDKDGKLVDVTLGYDNLDSYVTNSPYFGALIGRYGNRIGAGKFTLNGTTYTLATNNGPNHLHGGLKGFDKRVWSAKSIKWADGVALELKYRSADMEEGYPGNLDVTAVYVLTDANELKVLFTAKTDKATVANLTHHSYFNLSGGGTILDHLCYINADKTTPVDSGLITTGEIKPVDGTPFDFRKPTTIGERIDAPDTVLQYGPGYDHNWVVNQKKPGEITLQARVSSPKTGIAMEVLSDEPCLQFYAGNFLDGTIHGKDGQIYAHRTGFCMEPQHAPDSPNKPNWPSVVLKPGQTFHNTIIYKFSAQK